MPRISIVTPSFNQAAFLGETIESVLSQSYPNLDFQVLDGGSTDGSAKIIQRYERHLTFWRSAPDGGQAAALSEGFERADGEIFSWLNSDDVLEPGALRAVAEAWEEFGPGIMITGGCRVFDRHSSNVHWPSFGEINRLGRIPLERLLDIDGHWQMGDFFYQPETFVPASDYRAVGGLNPDFFFTMDYDLWIRLAIHGTQIVSLTTVLAGFRRHGEQKTAQRNLVEEELIATANRYLLEGFGELSPTGRSMLIRRNSAAAGPWRRVARRLKSKWRRKFK